MNTDTTIFKIHKNQILFQFVKSHFLKYPIFKCKTTLLLKHMIEETNLYRHECYSCMTGVALGHILKLTPLLNANFNFENRGSSLPPGCNVQNNAKPFSSMVYGHIDISRYTNIIVRLLMSWKKNDKN